ncbi:hypothetical protein BRADI_2g41314v3 [Brachypodium distachyon]|uniref:C2H2-type domain-containing protein n=1 Tax=Brachypodium distachyon TaxID=15368 RepID=A0A0Q3J6X8_BRADI|nr:hypothetical protein BRADI_2g41314v3 [Brachypodium distachyon]
MDPNGSYHNYAIFSESGSDISPLHEALSGTTAMPMLDEFVSPTFQPPPHSNSMRNTAPTANALEVPMPPKNQSNLQDQTNVPSAQPPVLPHTNTYHSPSITSLLQGDPIASVHAHLNTIGGLDDGPIFENPTMLFTGVPLGYASSPPNLHPFSSNTIYTQQIQHGALYNEDIYGVRTPSGPSAIFPSTPREDTTLIDGQTISFASDVMQDSMRSGHICRFCNATFNLRQAYGGHMSHHSKQNKKNLQG